MFGGAVISLEHDVRFIFKGLAECCNALYLLIANISLISKRAINNSIMRQPGKGSRCPSQTLKKIRTRETL